MTETFLLFHGDPIYADALSVAFLGAMQNAAAFFNDPHRGDIFFFAAQHHFFHTHFTGIVQCQLQNGGTVALAAFAGAYGIADMAAVFL